MNIRNLNVILTLFLTSSRFKYCFGNERIPMILDLINNYNGNVAAKLCWSMSDKIKLATRIMKAENSRNVQFINNVGSIKKFIGEDLFILFDLNCLDSHLEMESQTLIKETDINIFEKPLRWLMLSDNQNFTAELKNLSIFINSEVIVAHRQEGSEILHLIYKIDSSSEIITEFFGVWSPQGLDVNKDMNMTTVLRRKNLRGKTITISTVVSHEETKTELFNIDYSNINTDLYAKYTFINLAPLYDFINVTLKVIFTDTWGYPTNGSWSGMVGQIVRGEADLCGTMVFFSLARSEKITYLTHTIPMRPAFVFLAPPLSLQNNLFILPFKKSVWACLGALTVILAIITFIIAKWEQIKGAVRADDATALHPHAGDVTMYVTGAITQQGNANELKGSLGRLVTFITLLSFLFIYTSYSASIVALLQSTSGQIRTLSDLLNSKLELGVEDVPYNRHYFTTATDRVRKLIYETKVARVGYKPNFMNITEGVRRIQSSATPFAFHMYLGQGYKIVNRIFQEHEKCGLREIDFIPRQRTWFCAPKKSPYNEIYKLGLVRITEHGLTDRIDHQVQARKPACTTSGGTVASVNMVDFEPVLLCWLYGVIVSIAVLLLEILVHRRLNTHSEISVDLD